MIRGLGRGRRKSTTKRSLGRPLLPSRPYQIVLTDREDGTLWYLTQNDEDGPSEGFYIAINTEAPAINVHKRLITYDPYSGPFIDAQRGLRLLVRDGRLGYEQVEPQGRTDIDTHVVYAHTGRAENRCQLLPLGWATDGDTIGYVTP